MNELDELKKKRMEELQKQALQEQDERAQFEQQVAQLEAVVKSLFTKEALSRYGNLKAAHPEKAVQLLVAVAQMVQSGKIKKIDDNELKQMLMKLQSKVKQIKITRK